MELLRELEQRGIKIKLISSNKLWLGPKEKLTPDLLTKARQHKRRLIEALFNDMTLDEFERVNEVLKVQSAVLNETIYFASNDEVAEKLKNEGFTIYTADELKVLAKRKPQPKELKLLHEIKNVFPGSKIIQ